MIPVFRPLLSEQENQAARAVLDVGWLGMGKHVGEFENEISNYLELTDRYVVALSTGHAALHLGLLLMGVGPGDEVLTPAFNNVADFQAICACGATPVFCDIEEDTLCIDLEKARELISERTKAIIVMDYDCILCDHDAIAAFAKEFNLRVMHDAAHSFGSKYKGRKVGSFSDVTMFSFDPVKTITSLDGGALIVRTKEEVSRLHEMRLVGMTQPSSTMYENKRAWTYDVRHLGYRYHMSNMHAAIGVAQLKKIQIIEESRQNACRLYNRKLSKIESIIVPKTNFNDVVPFLYYIRVAAADRDRLREFLFEKGVDNGIHWQPGLWFSLFKDARRGDLSVTDQIASEILSLPLHSCMKEADQLQVIDAIESFYGVKK